MSVKKSSGVTDSEQYLARRCEGTFLRLWSYPNVFRDQGIGGTTHEGKELCDLLVVCGDDVIVFSDKSCAFPDTGDTSVDWRRWSKRAIKESVRQVLGAERWVRDFPSHLYLDRRCTQPFPLKFPDRDRLRFHRVVVAMGAKARCKLFTGGSGSLLQCPQVVADGRPSACNPPFFLLDDALCPHRRGVVHVLDDVTMDVLLGELDTVTDFIKYLSKKEALIASGRLGFAAGEEDLFAEYIAGEDERHEHDFQFDHRGPLVVSPGRWDAIVARGNYRAAKIANKPSYLWDEIINSVTTDLFDGTLLGTGATSVESVERALRAMAMETRLHRRMLVEAFLNGLRNTGENDALRRVVAPRVKDESATVYAFILMPFADEVHEEYRQHRARYLTAYCEVVAWSHREAKEVVGIATESGVRIGRSYDFVYISVKEWTPERSEAAKKLAADTGFYQPDRLKKMHHQDDEYPHPWTGERVTMRPWAG